MASVDISTLRDQAHELANSQGAPEALISFAVNVLSLADDHEKTSGELEESRQALIDERERLMTERDQALQERDAATERLKALSTRQGKGQEPEFEAPPEAKSTPQAPFPPVMKEVYSSHVNRVGYAQATGDLHVEWDTGKTSIYSGVPPETADMVMSNWSVGTALREHVKPNFAHRYA